MCGIQGQVPDAASPGCSLGIVVAVVVRVFRWGPVEPFVAAAAALLAWSVVLVAVGVCLQRLSHYHPAGEPHCEVGTRSAGLG